MRPIFTMSSNSAALVGERVAQARAPTGPGGARSPRPRRCASRWGTCRSTTATCSRGRSGGSGPSSPLTPPASSIARFEMTSLTFMFVWVPLPVCHTNSGKWSSSVAREDLVGGPTMRLGLLVGELPEVAVHERRGLLEDRHAPDDRRRHAVAADREVVQRALRLRTPVAIVGDLDRVPCCRSRCGWERRSFASLLSPARTYRSPPVPPARCARRTWRSIVARTTGASRPTRPTEQRGLESLVTMSRSRSMPRTMSAATSSAERTLIFADKRLRRLRLGRRFGLEPGRVGVGRERAADDDPVRLELGPQRLGQARGPRTWRGRRPSSRTRR